MGPHRPCEHVKLFAAEGEHRLGPHVHRPAPLVPLVLRIEGVARALAHLALEPQHASRVEASEAAGWWWKPAESATSAGLHGHKAASHWAPSGSVARPEYVAQSSPRRASPSRPGQSSCGTTKGAL
eukprot:scaffold8290_cov62-Phaeocystis_antarctica.AAC.6